MMDKLKVFKHSQKYVYNESTSVVTQLAYIIQTFLALQKEGDVGTFLQEQSQVQIPSRLIYKDSYFDRDIGTCGVTFLDTEKNVYILGYSGTNVIANRLKDIVIDLQIVLGYPTLEALIENFKERIITPKKGDYEIFAKMDAKLLALLDEIDATQSGTPEYIGTAVSYYDTVASYAQNLIVTGHSLGGNIGMIVALVRNHRITITYNSAPLFVRNDVSDFTQHIQELIPQFTGEVIRFVTADDPLNAVSERLHSCFIGKKILLEGTGLHGIQYFFAPSIQTAITTHLENICYDATRDKMEERRIIMFEKLVNFRDLGGIKTEQGKKIASNKLFRSGELTYLTAHDIVTLEELGLATIIDMRTASEVRKSPNKHVANTKTFYIDFFGGNDTMQHKQGEDNSAPTMENMMKHMGDIDADAYMTKIYKEIIHNTHAQAGIIEFFRIIREEETAILWHCFAGKDRTGATAALLLAALGVSEADIMADFLATNPLRKADNDKTIASLRAKGIPEDKLTHIETMLYVKAIYLEAAFAEIAELAGSVSGYLTDVLGITPAEIVEIQEKYLI